MPLFAPRNRSGRPDDNDHTEAAVHLFFKVFAKLVTERPLRRGAPEGTIVLHLHDPCPSTFTVELAHKGRRVISGAVPHADLVVETDHLQLEELILTGQSKRPLHYHGRQELLTALAELMGTKPAPVAS